MADCNNKRGRKRRESPPLRIGPWFPPAQEQPFVPRVIPPHLQEYAREFERARSFEDDDLYFQPASGTSRPQQGHEMITPTQNPKTSRTITGLPIPPGPSAYISGYPSQTSYQHQAGTQASQASPSDQYQSARTHSCHRRTQPQREPSRLYQSYTEYEAESEVTPIPGLGLPTPQSHHPTVQPERKGDWARRIDLENLREFIPSARITPAQRTATPASQQHSVQSTSGGRSMQTRAIFPSESTPSPIRPPFLPRALTQSRTSTSAGHHGGADSAGETDMRYGPQWSHPQPPTPGLGEEDFPTLEEAYRQRQTPRHQ